MRLLLLGLILLAGLKIWVQDNVYRAATEHALVQAYVDRAVIACKSAEPSTMASLPEGFAVDWSRDAKLTIGNSAIRINIWDFDNELWAARFKKAYLIVSAETAGLSCAYDIAAGTASVSKS